MDSEELGYLDSSLENLRMLKIMYDAGFDVSTFSNWNMEPYAFNDCAYDILYESLQAIFGEVEHYSFYEENEDITELKRFAHAEYAIVITESDIVSFFDSLDESQEKGYLAMSEIDCKHVKGRGIFILYDYGLWMGDSLPEFIELGERINEAKKTMERKAEDEVSNNI